MTKPTVQLQAVFIGSQKCLFSPDPSQQKGLLSPDSLMQVWSLLLAYPGEVWDCVALVHAGM